MDNDGNVDAFFTNGMIRNTMDSDLRRKGSMSGAQQNRTVMSDLLRNSEPLREANLAFQNTGNLRFQNVGQAWGLAHVGISTSAAFADLDNDGDQDLVVNNYNEPVSIYRNQTNRGHAIRIRLQGTRSNRFGVGTVARIQTAAGIQVRRLSQSHGYMSSQEPELHFGLGALTHVDKLTLSWPSGHVQRFESLPADHAFVIREPSSLVDPTSTRSEAGFHADTRSDAGPRSETDAEPMFVDVTEILRPSFRHIEREFEDFATQPLLPYRLSRLGSGVSFGDVDGDGDDDLFLAGAAGQSGQLYIVADNGDTFNQRDGPWRFDAEQEDMAPLWLDADVDGDLDLFVTSGGVEAESGDPLLRDRLYLNDGHGEFQKAPRDALPDSRESSSVATAADYDQDGDVDLFVGGRVVPGKYPLSPPSALLRNDGGRFVDVTASLAAGLRTAGLVTAALWSDVDGNGRVDLLVASEWGPVRLFRNVGGSLREDTSAAGLANHLGWWNGITGGDLDNDGDIDYVVTNLGLNTKYHASRERPTLLYYGDVAGRGENRLIEAAFEDDRLFPLRGRSCTTGALPSLATKFPTYRSFASAELNAIYSSQRLADARRYEANEFESVVLVNDGQGVFRVDPLPRLAQAAPSFGVAIQDFDGDGFHDVYLVQNFFAPQPETGRMDGGLSLLLKGDGNGGLTPVGPAESGLLVPGDGKGLGTTDLDRDGWPDVAIGQNDLPTRLMRHVGMRNRRSLAIRLQGTPGNPTAAGARVAVQTADGVSQTAEVYAGSGYLSQSAPVLFFGRGRHRAPVQVTVRWPDGSRSAHTIDERQGGYVVLSERE